MELIDATGIGFDSNACVQVSFDEYLQNRARVFRAMFPDESRSQRLSDVLAPISRSVS
jgi:hypothetical protein